MKEQIEFIYWAW